MNKTIICIAARMKSSRFTKKSTRMVRGIETIRFLIRRLKLASIPEEIVLCTSTNREDRVLAEIAMEENIEFLLGDELDVLSRFVKAAERRSASTIVRVTGDDILVDTEIMDKMIDFHRRNRLDYTYDGGLPKGLECEIMDVETLNRIKNTAQDTQYTEYLSWYIKRPDRYRILAYPIQPYLMDFNLRLTLDYPEDFELVKELIEHYPADEYGFMTKEIIDFFKERPELKKKNMHCNKPYTIEKLNIKFKGEE